MFFYIKIFYYFTIMELLRRCHNNNKNTSRPAPGKVVVVYGFDFEYKIWPVNTKGAILCKSLRTNLPVYAAPCIIEETNLTLIMEKMAEMETIHPEMIDNIREIAKIRCAIPSWKIVLYGDNSQISAGYESEGDEDGNGR